MKIRSTSHPRGRVCGSYTQPMGIATYRTADELPANFRVLAPIMEEVPKMLNEAEAELDGGRHDKS